MVARVGCKAMKAVQIAKLIVAICDSWIMEQ
jgi:hypothetical protein